ncbi:hypothetical protein GMSM_41020 [Geomonas sp. Red276]
MVAAIVLVAAGFFLIDRFVHFQLPTPKAPPQTASKEPIPPRPPAMSAMSSAATPAAHAPSPAHREQPVAPIRHPGGPGRLAIIIDDMGASPRDLQALLSIGLPLTFSVIPSLAHARDVADAAHSAGAEVMIHMPMEPEGYPQQPLEKIGLLLSMSDGEVEQRARSYFGMVPHATGANNHMGSRFTQDAGKMEVVLKVLKEKGFFFVDSKTSPASVGSRVARRMGVRTGDREVFLDNVQSVPAIRSQLEKAAAIAGKRGEAIAICHPHPATIQTLKAALPELAASGITFVHASALVR